MNVESNKLYDMLEDSIEYPANSNTVKETVGNVEITAPDIEKSLSISQLLEHMEEDTFSSSNDLSEAIHSLLPEAYIGRKYYDDRSDNVKNPDVKDDESF